MLLLFLVIFCLLPTTTNALRLADEITVGLSPIKNHCFRLLNGTESVGCQSDRQGNEGAVVMVHNSSDIPRAVSSLPLGVGTKIVAVVDVRRLDGELVDVLSASGDVSGVILIQREGEEVPEKFSEDSASPNGEFSFYGSGQRELNKEGALHFPRGLRFLSFDKPIFLISNQTEIDVLVNKCFAPFNQPSILLGKATGGGERCVARMTQFMLAAGNAEVCQRRQSIGGFSQDPVHLCDPLEDKNVFALLPALSEASAKSGGVFVLGSRMDSFSTFTESRGGDMSVLSSLIALLAVADATGGGDNLERFHKEAEKANKQLAWAFFHGVGFDLIIDGSTSEV